MEGVRGGKGGLRPKVERAERETHRDLSGTETHTFTLQYCITHYTKRQCSYEEDKNKNE